jgi:Asp-tRNA(Asn)/Glu-tRNA(Gln) amidotransferase A subunit family amidase
MDKTPLIVCPVGATPAFEHDAHKVTVAGQSVTTFRAFSYSQAFNVFDLPVVTIQAGRSKDGLPIGVQIVGRPFEEEMVLKVAEVVSDVLQLVVVFNNFAKFVKSHRQAEAYRTLGHCLVRVHHIVRHQSFDQSVYIQE